MARTMQASGTRALKAALATTQNKKQIGPIRRRHRHSAMPDKQPQLGMFSLYNINTFTQVPESTTQFPSKETGPALIREK